MDEAVIGRMVQVGRVMSVDRSNRTARVKFADTGIVSGHLKVLKNPPFIPADGAPQQTGTAGGGSGEASFEAHAHSLTVTPWFPRVNDTVLVLYPPVRDSDGFIIGGI